ncbi:ribonuclease H-like domain-containing protein [Tanacetum coccineum]
MIKDITARSRIARIGRTQYDEDDVPQDEEKSSTKTPCYIKIVLLGSAERTTTAKINGIDGTRKKYSVKKKEREKDSKSESVMIDRERERENRRSEGEKYLEDKLNGMSTYEFLIMTQKSSKKLRLVQQEDGLAKRISEEEELSEQTKEEESLTEFRKAAKFYTEEDDLGEITKLVCRGLGYIRAKLEAKQKSDQESIGEKQKGLEAERSEKAQGSIDDTSLRITQTEERLYEHRSRCHHREAETVAVSARWLDCKKDDGLGNLESMCYAVIRSKSSASTLVSTGRRVSIVSTGGQSGPSAPPVPKTAKQLAAKRNQERVKSILLLAIPDEYLLKFYNVPDAKSFWEAIKSRFGGNEESKEMQKNVLKHQFENFTTAPNESLDKAYDRFQKLIKTTSKTNEVSTASGNFEVNTTRGTNSSSHVSSTPGADEVVCSFFAQQTTSHPLDNEDLFIKKTRRNLDFKGKQPVTFDKSQVECYNCHRKWHFAKECKLGWNQGKRSYGDNGRRNATTNEPSLQVPVAQDGLRDYD